MANLTLKAVHKTYGNHSVIKGVDLEIKDREFVVFVGPSGCGKSTLLRMIAGLEEITSGDLILDGQRVNDVAPAGRGLAMVFQSYALYPHMTVAENMAFSLKLARVPQEERDAKVKAAAGVLQLDHLLDRKPGQLSGGQRQRVAIGRAIVRQPKVFLFDEPLSNLDAALRVQMRIELARLHEQLDATMVYVTHDQVEAMTLASKIVVLRGGVVEQVGSPLELYHHPRNLFVAGFIGSPTMNTIPVRCLGAGEDGVTVGVGQGAVTVPVRGSDALTGRALTLGVRPEHLTLDDAGPVRGEVSVVERLGGQTFLYVQTAEAGLLVVEADGETAVDLHETVGLSLRADACHLFNADGLALDRLNRHALLDRKAGRGSRAR
ncbi:ABC transporter ATP-binding protein [Azospirillum griseum]|uniref:sn-glycerol-3-phosphate ABC transporter ATP-binding protein UgpC n=1 Tax=Azospirillum griseum TaxID=2496639 RepID=A0A431VFA4_9PROT|nr:sn-glycerol-3-phosphate ABC transporter ATP-binding protein UgpC [Azospirillum griseum]RTR18904.1 sn-glycerol-3-phosphate ABC transporter ATP-binding protein UgpC [Azospirillum griseum]